MNILSLEYTETTTVETVDIYNPIAYPDFETLSAGNEANIELHFQEE